MDVWQDQIFFHETVYPAGHFSAELLNVSQEIMRNLVTHGSTISHQLEALAGRGEFINLPDGIRASLEKLPGSPVALSTVQPDEQREDQHTLEVLFFPASHNNLLNWLRPSWNFSSAT